MVHPLPQKIEAKEYISCAETPAIKLTAPQDFLEKRKASGSVFSESGNVEVTAVIKDCREYSYINEIAKFTREKYILEISGDEKQIAIKAYAASQRGLWYALNTIEKFAAKNSFPIGTITDYPLFEMRGLIEGFYGNPWSFEARREIIALAAKNNMNTYFYAPKDDSYHRRRWRELYPEKELSELADLVRFTGDVYMDFHYCIAPGLSMCYSSEADFEDLVNKTKQLYSIGIRKFGLLLDDIPEKLAHKEDVEQYGETVNAHIDLINRYYDFVIKLDGENELTICPMLYHGKGNEYYIAKLGQTIPPMVNIFWTGLDICSREITTYEAIRFIDNTKHRPLYWDNYPVNDAEMLNEMHIGPIIGRENDLYKSAKGLIANCMEYAQCTKIPLMTIADYLWNPEKYDSDSSFRNAVDANIEEEGREHFIIFADHLKTSCLKDANSYIMEQALVKAAAMLTGGDFLGAFSEVEEYGSKLFAAADYLKDKNEGIYAELKRWKDKFVFCAEIFEQAVEYMNTGDEEVGKKIAEMNAKYNSEATVLTGFCFRAFIELILAGLDVED